MSEQATGNTASAHAVFLDLADFAPRSVPEQTQLKERLEAIAAAAIAPLAERDRIVLDAIGGLAIIVLGAADIALDLGESILRKGRMLPLRIGINHGPVRLAFDARGDKQLVGDGLAAAMTIASLAAPNRLLVSRAFRDALATSDAERAQCLRAAGTFTDQHVRAHEVYVPDLDARAARRRKVWLLASLTVAGLVGAGVAVRIVRLNRARLARTPAVVELAIRPAGEVFVDSEHKGRTPPLQRIDVPPGRHVIEVRSPGNPPVTLTMELAPGETVNVRHDFPPPRSAPQKTEQPSRARALFRELRRWVEPTQ